MIMWIWLSICTTIVAGLITPFSDRLHDTSLWAGKVLTPPEFAAANPRGLQEPLTAGWPSTLIFIASCLPVAATVFGFIYAWWAGIIAYLVTATLVAVGKQTSVASKMLERYLMILLSHAQQRSATFLANGDTERSEAARELADDLARLLRLYLGIGVQAPTRRQVRDTQFGDRTSLLPL